MDEQLGDTAASTPQWKSQNKVQPAKGKKMWRRRTSFDRLFKRYTRLYNKSVTDNKKQTSRSVLILFNSRANNFFTLLQIYHRWKLTKKKKKPSVQFIMRGQNKIRSNKIYKYRYEYYMTDCDKRKTVYCRTCIVNSFATNTFLFLGPVMW